MILTKENMSILQNRRVPQKLKDPLAERRYGLEEMKRYLL